MSSEDFFLRWIDLIVLTAISMCLCCLLISMRHKLPRLSGRPHDLSAVQAAHCRKTPRVGGVAIFAALLAGLFFIPHSSSMPYFELVFASSILFAVALCEDLGFDMSPRARLVAALVASLVAMILLGYWLPQVGLDRLDFIAEHWMTGIPITLIITAGLANGFNVIDGVNGLSSIAAMGACYALGQIAGLAGDAGMMQTAYMLGACIFGFFLVNFPSGRIFLGDAGAYTLGFMLSWIGIAILNGNPDVSPWAILLAVFWPVADIALALSRRFLEGNALTAPDRLHVHQMTMRALEIYFVGPNKRSVSNPLTTAVLAPFVLAPALLSVTYWSSDAKSFFMTVFLGLAFTLSYIAIPKLLRRYKPRIRAVSLSV